MVAAVGLSPPTGVLETETLMLCHDYSAKYRKALLPSATYPLVAGMYVCMYATTTHQPQGVQSTAVPYFHFHFHFHLILRTIIPRRKEKRKMK